jgi:thiol-disulfide isomerase/thioredoxin
MVRSTHALFASALVVLAFGTVAALPAWSGEHADALPRYRWEVGQELTYTADSEFKYGKPPKQSSFEDHTEWKVWIIRKNDDGSYRVVVRSAEASKQNGKVSGHARGKLAYFEIFPDGRILRNSTIGLHIDPTTLFPKLPSDEREAKNGWQDHQQLDDARSSFEIAARPKDADRVWTFRVTRKSLMDEIYLSAYKATVTFDGKRGLVTKTHTETTQGYGIDGKGNDTTEFVSAATHDAAWCKQLADESDRYFAAQKLYEEKTRLASRDAGASKKLLAEAKDVLVAAQKVVTLPTIKEALDQAVKQHEQMAPYFTQEAQRRAEVVGRPAADFKVDDLKGHPHSLKDFKGKVVILDFWYRGCGWCMRAMPQVKQVENDFRDQPVIVLGMNTDRKEEDAKFVIDKMGLTYLTLKAQDLPQKYGVQGFPTLVIIDKEGKLQDLYVGYSPDLRKEVGEIVHNLLAKK